MTPQKTYVVVQVMFAVLSVIVIGFFVNPHMDEYIQFSSLAYLKPAFKYNIYNDGFDYYVVYLFNYFKYRMSYYYIGNTSSILYYPFYRLLPYHISNAVYSIVFLLLFSFLFRKSGRFSIGGILMILCFFPIVFQVLHDAGPIKMGLLAFPLSAILLNRILVAEHNFKKLVLGICLGLIWFVAIEDKIFFVYLFPGVILFSFGLLPDQFLNLKYLRRQIRYLLLPIGVFAALASILLFATVRDANGHCLFYITHITHLKDSATPDLITAVKSRIYVFQSFFRYVEFPYYANRNVMLRDTYFRVFAAVALYGLLALVLWRQVTLKKGDVSGKRMLLLLGSFLSMVMTFLLLGNTTFGHHYIFIWIPLLAIVCVIEDKWPKVFNTISQAFLVYSAASLFLIATSKPWINNSSDIRNEISCQLDSLNANGKYIINYSNWNGFFIRELNPCKNEIVTYISKEDRNVGNYVNGFTQFSIKNKLPVLNVSEYPATPDSLRLLFPAIKRTEHINSKTLLHGIDILYFF